MKRIVRNHAVRALAVGTTSLLAGSLFAADGADAKSRVDAFLAKEFEGGALKCMSCAYEQHGETRYRFVAQKGWEGFDENTPLHVASITKVFTATLLMQLSEEGKLSLNDYVRKYIPEFPGENVPIINLMTHTSGWRNRTGHVAKAVDEKRHDEFYATMYQDFEVNEKFRYMSQGYDILAEICEKVTGAADVADLARDRIFRPLGMEHSAFAAHQGQSGLHITAPDLVKFGRHLLDIRRTRKAGILTPQGADALFRRCLKPEFNRTPAFLLLPPDRPGPRRRRGRPHEPPERERHALQLLRRQLRPHLLDHGDELRRRADRRPRPRGERRLRPPDRPREGRRRIRARRLQAGPGARPLEAGRSGGHPTRRLRNKSGQ